MHENSLICILFNKKNTCTCPYIRKDDSKHRQRGGSTSLNIILILSKKSKVAEDLNIHFFTFKFKEHFDCKCKAVPFVARCLKCTIIGRLVYIHCNYIRDKVYASYWCFCRPMKTGNK